jgi:Methyltransferase domain
MRRRLLALLLRLLRPRFPRSVGLFEIAAYPFTGTIEWTRRHALLIEELERHRAGAEVLTVLDFGGAGGSLGRALRLYGRDRHYRLILADVDRETVEGTPIDNLVIEAIVLDPAGSIPLADRSVDVAVSSDVFEHIPLDSRAHWAAELLRVARLGQAHTFPADSGDGRWASTQADRTLDAWHRERFDEPERWTAEHLANAEPTIEEMMLMFPNCNARGFANVDVWGEMLRDQLGVVAKLDRLRFGLHYLHSLRAADRRPPWKGCLLTSGR